MTFAIKILAPCPHESAELRQIEHLHDLRHKGACLCRPTTWTSASSS
jgi:hypothetical protein